MLYVIFLQDLYILRVCFLAHIVQLVLTYKEDRVTDEEAMQADEEDEKMNCDTNKLLSDLSLCQTDEEWLLLLRSQCRQYAALPEVSVNAHNLLEYVKKNCLPFLRCCGLFFHFLTEIPVPEELNCSVWLPESEFLCLLRYLGLAPHLRQSHEEACLSNLIEM